MTRTTLYPTASATPTNYQANANVPSIRLVAATPSASGLSSEANTSVNTSWTASTIATPLSRSENEPPRRKLVPKKSKLGLLGSNKDKGKERGDDLSDVIRRVGGSSSARRGFDIYVDPTDDPEMGEILMVKKKKSRAALDGMRWGNGALEEVTNIPSAPAPVTTTNTLKVKNEGKEKWWTIGRGRKDSKEKEKEKEREKEKEKEKAPIREKAVSRPEPPRSKTPEPFKSPSETQSRARFNSLDSGMLLTTASAIPAGYNSRNTSTPLLNMDSENLPPQQSYSRAGTPTLGGLLAPPTMNGALAVPSEHTAGQNQNSIALRAMRSMRSLARIGSWAQLKNGSGPGEATVNAKEVENQDKEKDDGKKKGTKKKKEKSEKEKKGKEKEKGKPVRSSGSSFEIGAASPNPASKQSLGKKKRSILGLGLPSTMRLPNVRSGSTASSISANGHLPSGTIDNNRLSVDSAILLASRGRSGSTATSILSSGSSLRPLSTASTNSRESSGSSAASVKWDEEGLETVKEQRRKEKESRRGLQDKTKRKVDRESRRASEERKRTPISDVFPEVYSNDEAPESPARRSSVSSGASSGRLPLLTLEEATSDGHGRTDDERSLGTPSKRVRPRPVSEQLLMKSRPRAMHEDDGDGVMSILSAATNELAQLINHLDLEATPGTTPGTPESFHWRPPRQEEPVPALPCEDSPTKKKTLRKDVTSISSLRPYAQTRSNIAAKSSTISASGLLGQQIAPWPTLNAMFPKDSPAKLAPPEVAPLKPKRVSHKRTMSPPNVMIEATPPPPLRALRPAQSRPALATMKPLGPPPSSALPEPTTAPMVRAPSSLTFGSRSSSRGGNSSIGSLDGVDATATVLKPRGHARNRSSLLSSQMGSQGSIPEEDYTTSRPLAPGARRMLGMKGTMGGSDVSAYIVDDIDVSDPDSDIPDELQNILASQSDRDDTLSFRAPPSPPAESPAEVPHFELELGSASEPEMDIPVFHANVLDENENLVDDVTSEEESDHTKKSFDFTGELNKLNESGASDRRSFVEQLENAFKTPAKIDLRCDFGNGFLHADAPPLPPLPSMFSKQSVPEDVSTSYEKREVSVSSTDVQACTSTQGPSVDLKSLSLSQLLDHKEPTLLPGSDSLSSQEVTHETDICMELPRPLKTSTSTSSSRSRASDGELNRSFKFGGVVPKPSIEKEQEQDEPLTLSDIIPPPSRARALSTASSEVDDSVLKSIMEKATEVPLRQAVPRPRVNSDSSTRRRTRNRVQPIIQYRHSRHESGISFTGFDSFEEVRRGFEFHDHRPGFYPPSANNSRLHAHSRQESTYSFASISSYGHVLNNGVADPFDYGLPSLQERPSSEDLSSISMSVDDTFSFMHHDSYRRRRVESDASSFYFNPAPSNLRGHRRQDSNMSVVSQAPPISLYNRSFAHAGHRRNESTASINSSFGMHGASARHSWMRHRHGASADSIDSRFSSAMQLGRPGIGDKMFDGPDYGAPLESISASPPESTMADRMANRTSYDYDSILDADPQSASATEDSLFEKTGNRTSVSSESVFGYDDSTSNQLLPPMNYRPLSSMSFQSIHSPMKEDDTMISMLGGGHVRRCSVGSVIQASPCVRVGKRKQPVASKLNEKELPHVKAQPSIASTSSSVFGGERMIRAKRGILERQSLEESVLMAEGEDLSISFGSMPVFSRPAPSSRSRSSTCTSISSGADTPPLSASDGSSASEGSQSSIDLNQLSRLLANTSHPAALRTRTRTRARGQGHRRRISQARASRSSVYETIEEEFSSPSSSPGDSISMSKGSPTAIQPVYIVDPDAASVHSVDSSFWDDESRLSAMRRYNELRHEAEYTVTESKRVWSDTPFSLYALQSFDPPRHPAGMRALLADSVQNYGPLPSEHCTRRRRISSRASPYPQTRAIKVSMSPEGVIVPTPAPELLPPVPIRAATKFANSPLQPKAVNSNVSKASARPLVLKPKKSLAKENADKSFEAIDPDVAFGPPKMRPRVGSAARRTALGWSKRSTGKTSSDLKENSGTMMTPSETLRLSRPRPRGRPTPARSATVRV
ncbi:hypothetical protein AAF712_010779 [Marasmius tenuissimus]|uniref:Uncharacterized protein n=1 Tax=Marasmius tenuissimus TaxID=585030 RepID=A0ABR2ZLY8_9AGAR